MSMPLSEKTITLPPLGQFSLHAAVFVAGFVTMALEMLIGRTFIPYFGGTIYTWGALISVFLIGMTIGYVLGGKVADRRPDVRIVSVLFGLSAATMVLLPAYGDAIINLIIDQIEDMRYAALVASIALACLPAALLAAIGPFCVRLLLDSKSKAGTVSGRLSALNTAGSILGTLGTSFYFIPSFGMRLICVALALVSLAFGLVLWVLAYRRSGGVVSALASPVIVGVAAVLLATVATPSQAQQSALLLRKNGLLERVDSEYNTVFVEKQGSAISLNFGYRNNRYTESVIDLNNRDELVVTYTRYMSAALAYNPNPVHSIAMIGLGGGRTISYLVASLPQAVADVAELDPAVIGLAKTYFGVESNKRLRIHAKDGRVFMNQKKDKYDLILVDAYRGPFVPFHLTTQEFYRLLKSRLNEGGVVAQNVEPTTLFFDSSYATMKSVFDQVDAIDAGGNIVLIGYPGKRLTDAELASRAEAAQIKLKFRYDLRDLVKARKEVQAVDKAKLLTDDFAPVENLKTIKRHNEKRE